MSSCDYPMWMVLLVVFICSIIAPYVGGFVVAAWKDYKQSKKAKLRCKHKNTSEYAYKTFCEDCGEEVFYLNVPSPSPPSPPTPPPTRDLPR